eukprot:COSAG01_NODE_5729_length_4071_cov_9.539023_5_plen_207_part_00
MGRLRAATASPLAAPPASPPPSGPAAAGEPFVVYICACIGSPCLRQCVHGASVAAAAGGAAPSAHPSASPGASPCDLSGVWVAVGREDDGSAVRVRGAGTAPPRPRLATTIGYQEALCWPRCLDLPTQKSSVHAGAGGDHGIAKLWRCGGTSAVADELFDGAVRSTHARIPCRSWWSWWWALTVPSAARCDQPPPSPSTAWMSIPT